MNAPSQRSILSEVVLSRSVLSLLWPSGSQLKLSTVHLIFTVPNGIIHQHSPHPLSDSHRVRLSPNTPTEWLFFTLGLVSRNFRPPIEMSGTSATPKQKILFRLAGRVDGETKVFGCP